jgi:hypothetical protein
MKTLQQLASRGPFEAPANAPIPVSGKPATGKTHGSKDDAIA